MFDLNNNIFDHSMNDDMLPLSSSFENDSVDQGDLSFGPNKILFNEDGLLQNNDLYSSCQMDLVDNHLIEAEVPFVQHQESTELSDQLLGQIHNEHISFTGSIYSDAEIRHLQEDVSKYEYEVSNLKSEVHHQEIMEDSSKLDKAVSDLNYTIDKLNDAREKLNNAT